jgi:hypothetical protein
VWGMRGARMSPPVDLDAFGRVLEACWEAGSYVPPFAKARRMGHPIVIGSQILGGDPAVGMNLHEPGGCVNHRN